MDIPEGYKLLKDKDIIPKECFCFGELESGAFGWGKPSEALIGQSFCDGWAKHPDFIVVLKKDFPYIWFWRKKLPERKATPCRVLTRSKRMNSALIEFEDGYRVISSRNAIRKRKYET